MRAVIQRVTDASVTINRQDRKQIGPGLVILVGIEESDKRKDWSNKDF